MQRIEVRGVNTLSPVHNHERINLFDFYNPYFFPTKNVNFTDCDLYGPANIAWRDGSIQEVTFVGCEIVIVRDDRPLTGTMMFQNCNALRGRMVRLTMLMRYIDYQALPASMKARVPVISDGRIGDV